MTAIAFVRTSRRCGLCSLAVDNAQRQARLAVVIEH